MKTIEQMWEEYVNNNSNFGSVPLSFVKYIKNAFFAGFNQCYNIVNQGNGITPHPLKGGFYVEITEFEKEMDDHIDELDKGK